MVTPRVICLKQSVERLSTEVKARIENESTMGGKTILYSIAHWTYCLTFIAEYKFDKRLFDYLLYLIRDVQSLLVNCGAIEEILDEIRFYYDEANYQYMN